MGFNSLALFISIDRNETNNQFEIGMCTDSWGSGANPWGPEKEDQFTKPNHWDGMLEVVGVTGVVHLGQIQSGLRSAMRIAQVNPIHIKHCHQLFSIEQWARPHTFVTFCIDRAATLKFIRIPIYRYKLTANHGYSRPAMLSFSIQHWRLVSILSCMHSFIIYIHIIIIIITIQNTILFICEFWMILTYFFS